MMTIKLIIILAVGTVLMLIPMMIQAVWYKIRIWKIIITALLLTITGTVGTFIMYFIENRRFGGVSFFGAVFFVPIVFIVYSLILNEKYSKLMDLCAPAECMMLVLLKMQCLLIGCCKGMLIHTTSSGIKIYFPSQFAEMANALVLCIILLCFSKKKRNQGYVYPWFLILYGISRFILNCFRMEFWITDMFIPFGNIWSIVAIIGGIVWITILKPILPDKKNSVIPAEEKMTG